MTVLGLALSLNQEALAEEQPRVAESTTTSTNDFNSKSTMSSSTDTSATTASKSTAPKLLGVTNKKIAVSQPFDPKAGVTATDEKEGDLTSKIIVSGNINTQVAGEYPVTYSVTNAEGLKTQKTSMVRVQAAAAEDYKVEITDFSLYKNATFSNEIHQRMIIKNGNNEIVSPNDAVVTVVGEQTATQLGIVPIVFTVKLTNGPTIEHTVNVTVKSGIRVVKPKEEYTYTGSRYEDGIDLMNYIEAYESDTQGKETRMTAYNAATKTGIEVIKNDLNVSVPGRYAIVYRLTNSLGEVMEYTSFVTVIKPKDPLKPTIKVEDKTMYVGDRLTEDMIIKWAKTENAEQVAFEVINGEIQVNSLTDKLVKVGSYTIRFTASRKDETTGNILTEQAEMVLTVKEKEPTSSPSTTTTSTTITGKNNVANAQNVRTTKGTVPSTKAKSLPKTGSERGNVALIISGVALVLGSLGVGVRSYRETK